MIMMTTARIGFGDLSGAAVQAAAGTLLSELQSSGCQQGTDPNVQAFQQAYVDAGGNLPSDSNGSSGIDGLYGANTAAALQAVLNAGPNQPPQAAPAGCVAAASGGTGGGGGSTTLSTGQSASATGLPTWGWWAIGAAAVVGAGLIYESVKHHPMASRGGRRGPARRRTVRHRRRR